MKNRLIPGLVLGVLAVAAPAFADPSASSALPPFRLDPDAVTQAPVHHLAAGSEDGWQLTAGIPLWIPGINGDLTIRGTELSPDQDTDDVIDILDERLNFALALHFEARKGRFGFIVDALYADLRAEGNLGLTDAEAYLKGFIGEVAFFYSLVEPTAARKFGTFRLDALGGVRVTSLKIGIDADTFDISANHTLFDPMVGLRMELGLTEWLALKARGDIAGFGIDAWNTSDFSYNIDAGLAFYLGETFEIDLGYRWLKYDFVTDSGGTSFDATLHGPYVSLLFHF